MSETLRLQERIRSPLTTQRRITPLPYRSGTSFLAWAIVNNNQPVPDLFSKMTKIAASGRLGQTAPRYTRNAGAGGFQRARRPKVNPYPKTHRSEEHTSELQSLMRITYAVFRLKKKKHIH